MNTAALNPSAAVPPDSGYDPALSERARIDASCAAPVLWFFGSATAWLLVGSLLAFLASWKMHAPEFLAQWSWLTFGRVRPAHLNAMIYGWAAMAGIGATLWMQARLSRVTLAFPRLLVAVAVAWNGAVAVGVVGILAGNGTSVEWIEFPFPLAMVFAALFGAFAIISFWTFARRRIEHVYVTQWYLFGAIIWFPFLYFLANVLIHLGQARGVAQGAANWWFAHNVLGLFLTPIGVGAAYYLIPKVIGRPIHSYYVSLLGFWSLALFYNWAGTHHLVGGPLPAWVVTIGIVSSMMMFIPVTAVAINHHLTMVGSFHLLRSSPTLRFVVFGGMSYTIVSFQGSLEALRSINEVTHFTHYTVAHAHLGVYSFFTMTMFGAAYYILPRLTGLEWSSARLIRVHFWTVAAGMAIYWVGLTIGGLIQGFRMNDARVPFLDLTVSTVPWLVSRSVAGILMTTGHIAFAILVYRMLAAFSRGERGGVQALLAPAPAAARPARTEAAT